MVMTSSLLIMVRVISPLSHILLNSQRRRALAHDICGVHGWYGAIRCSRSPTEPRMVMILDLLNGEDQQSTVPKTPWLTYRSLTSSSNYIPTQKNFELLAASALNCSNQLPTNGCNRIIVLVGSVTHLSRVPTFCSNSEHTQPSFLLRHHKKCCSSQRCNRRMFFLSLMKIVLGLIYMWLPHANFQYKKAAHLHGNTTHVHHQSNSKRNTYFSLTLRYKPTACMIVHVQLTLLMLGTDIWEHGNCKALTPFLAHHTVLPSTTHQ